MPTSEWGLEFPDEWDLKSGDGLFDDADSPLNDPKGERNIERRCNGCGKEFLVNLYFADRVSKESPLCLCDACIEKKKERGRKRVQARDAEGSQDGGEIPDPAN